MVSHAAAPLGLPARDRCLVMGVVNVTPDSFSDGGLWFSAEAAIAHGLDLAASGADIVDVGGESTRPGAPRVSEEEELRRVMPVIAALVAEGLVVSVDTTRAAVAQAAIDSGVSLVNDVSGGLADPAMAALIAAAQVPYVVMHWRGHSAEMQGRAEYADVVAEVVAELTDRVIALCEAGVDPRRLIIDPGLGFAKLPAHNWALLARLSEISALACPGAPFPVLVGASRKRFIGRLLGAGTAAPRPFEECDDATIALTSLSALTGAWCVRVHQVRPNVDAVRIAARWQQELIDDRA